MKNSTQDLCKITCLLFLISCPIKAQISISSDSIRSKAISVFIDCRCDIDHIRREIPYVNYVRDVKLADVYIHETRQSSASGGSMYTYTFQGQNKYRGMSDTLTYSRNPDEVQDQTRAGRTQIIEL